MADPMRRFKMCDQTGCERAYRFEYSEDLVRCTRCGGELVAGLAKWCHGCHAQIVLDWRFCGYCGNGLTEFSDTLRAGG